MEFGICVISVAPVRSTPLDTAEMVTQLLFGDLVVVEEKKNNWFQIRNINDNYEGWIDNKQIQNIDESEFNRLKAIEPAYISDLVEVIQNKTTKELIPVLMGSSVRFSNNGLFTINNIEYIYTGQLITTSVSQKISIENICEFALSYKNAPYLWGGKSPFGIDCSGFIQMVYMINGIHLPRDASQQAAVGEDVSLLEEARTGDLLFFDNKDGNITHVGILLDDRKIIHASGQVRIDMIDHQGIYNQQSKRYTHNLRLIKRVV